MLNFLRLLISGGLLLLMLWGSGFYWFLQQIPREPITRVEQTDGLIILTGGEKRIDEGIRLLAESKARRLFISGVGRHTRREDILARLASPLPASVSPDQIELGYAALNTAGNADEANEWIRQNRLSSVRVITANYHLPRAGIEFARVAPGVSIVMHPVFPEPMFQAGWWKEQKMLGLLTYEYHKYLLAAYRRAVASGVFSL